MDVRLQKLMVPEQLTDIIHIRYSNSSTVVGLIDINIPAPKIGGL